MAQFSEAVQVPPQSTGKRVATTKITVLEFDQGNTNVSFATGTIVVGDSSGANGTITGITTAGFPTNEGRLFLEHSFGTFTDDEVLKVNSIQYARADLLGLLQAKTEAFDTQHIIVSDPDNPEYKQKIDQHGASHTTFNDGEPIFGAYGSLTVGERTNIKHYQFPYNAKNGLFDDAQTGSGTVTYHANTATVLLSCSTVSGDVAERTSNFYHPYHDGVGTEVIFNIMSGDIGKTNVTRRWGLFDDNNGLFWEMLGTSFRVGLRSNRSGSVVDTYIEQADFNTDPLDGTTVNNIDLDLTKGNAFVIDFQWPTGVVIFSVFSSEGKLVRAHTIKNANSSNINYMRTATLPVRVSQENTGTAGSTSELYFGSASVIHTSSVEVNPLRFSIVSNSRTANTTNGEQALFGVRPRTTFNSQPNHALYKPQKTIVASDPSATGQVVVRTRKSRSTSVTSASFADHDTSKSAFQIDTTGAAYSDSGSDDLSAEILLPGDSIEIQHNSGALHDADELFLDADETTQPEVYVTCDILGTGTANVAASHIWQEIQL